MPLARIRYQTNDPRWYHYVLVFGAAFLMWLLMVALVLGVATGIVVGILTLFGVI